MKKSEFHPSFLQIIYIIIYIVLFAFIIYVPKLVSGPVHITNSIIIEEEIIEGSLLAILFLINVLMLNLYRREASKQKELIRKINDEKKEAREKLNDSSKYIGQINVQIQEIKNVFNITNRFPATKKDLKKTILFLSNRVLGIVNAEWVLFRIINSNSRKTICEQFEIRTGLTSGYPRIGNKSILEQQSCPGYTIVNSNPQNSNILSSCILPVDQISNDERVFIQAITNEIAMMYIIFSYSNKEKLSVEYSLPQHDKTLKD